MTVWISARERILDRFVDALLSGEHCGTSARTPRRIAALNLSDLGFLTEYGLWPDAMRRVLVLGRVHPNAREQFLTTWKRTGYPARHLIGNDDLFFAVLRVLLPPYDGPAERLWRGQRQADPVGLSWTCSHHVAVKFALYGTASVDPHALHRAQITAYEDAVVLQATAREEIICAPCLLGYPEGEYIVDPRGLAWTSEAVNT